MAGWAFAVLHVLENLADTSLVRPILEYASSCGDLNREGQMNALDRAQNKAARFAHQRNDLNWESFEQSRNITRIYSVFNAYTGNDT
jgi:hypothetical protein